MARVLLLVPTTTYRTRDFVAAADRLGVDVTVASEEASSLASLNPTGLLRLSFSDPDEAAREALEFHARHPIDAVVPVDDQVTAAAAAIGRALSLKHNSPGAVLAARDKHRMRERLEREGIPSPGYRLGDVDASPEELAEFARALRYPAVVKPVNLSASQGVMRANHAEELVEAVRRLRGILATVEAEGLPVDARYLVEDFIPGREVALEGLLRGEELRVLALLDKPDPMEGPFFEETIFVTPSRLAPDIQERVGEVTARAVRALGLEEGPVHAELRINDAGPWVLEIHPRSIGGLCSRVLRFGVGISLEELIIRHALGQGTHELERERQPAGVMMIPIPAAGILAEVRGLEAARAVEGIEAVTISAHPGQRLVPLPEGNLYPGFIFARGPSPELVEAALREAHARLELVLEGSP